MKIIDIHLAFLTKASDTGVLNTILYYTITIHCDAMINLAIYKKILKKSTYYCSIKALFNILI